MATVGRPRSFDKDEALKKAMYVFWEKGYEGTTMADLIQSIGMKAPSIYAAFGNKDAIFKEVVQSYLPIVVDGQLKVLNSSPKIYDAVEATLNACVNLYTGEDNPPSCLVMTAAINTAPEHQEHILSLRVLRDKYKDAWQARFEQAEYDQQLADDANPSELAEYFTTLIQGMTIKAKDGANKEELTSTSKLALKTLSQYINQKNYKRPV
jgi:AcrR family transcriptional regulator